MAHAIKAVPFSPLIYAGLPHYPTLFPPSSPHTSSFSVPLLTCAMFPPVFPGCRITLPRYVRSRRSPVHSWSVQSKRSVSYFLSLLLSCVDPMSACTSSRHTFQSRQPSSTYSCFYFCEENCASYFYGAIVRLPLTGNLSLTPSLTGYYWGKNVLCL